MAVFFYAALSCAYAQGDDVEGEIEAEVIETINYPDTFADIQNNPVSILCLLGARDNEQVTAYCKEHGGVPADWDRRAGFYDHLTTDERIQVRSSLLYRHYEKLAAKSVFNYQINYQQIYRINIGQWMNEYARFQSYRGTSNTSELLIWEEWAKILDVPMYYSELVKLGHKKIKRRETSKYVAFDRGYYTCDVGYWKLEKDADPIISTITLKLKDDQTTNIPECDGFDYSPVSLTHYKNGCNQGDCENGEGVFYDSAQSIWYKGHFKNGKAHGQGQITRPSGGKKFEMTRVTGFKGLFYNGVPCGDGVLTFADGRKWDGQVKDWLPHGTGTMYSAGYEVTHKGYRYGDYYVEGKFVGTSKPLDFKFDECDQYWDQGYVKFDAREYQKYLNRLSDDLDSTIARISRLSRGVGKARNLYSGGTREMESYRTSAKELNELAEELKLYPITKYEHKLRLMAKNANCTIDMVATTETLIGELWTMHSEVLKLQNNMDILKTQMDLLKDAEVAHKYMISALKSHNGYVTDFNKALAEYNEVRAQFGLVKCK